LKRKWRTTPSDPATGPWHPAPSGKRY